MGPELEALALAQYRMSTTIMNRKENKAAIFWSEFGFNYNIEIHGDSFQKPVVTKQIP